MMLLRLTVLTCFGFIGGLFSACAYGQEGNAVDPRVAAVAPFLDADAFLVLHLDLKQVDVKGAVERVTALAPDSAKDMVANVRTMAAVGVQLRTQLVEAGVTDIYAIGTLGTGGEKPDLFVVIPVEKGKDVAAAKGAIELIPGIKEDQLFVHNGYVIGAPPVLKDYVTKIRPAVLPPLATAFQHSGNTAFQLIVLPTKKLAETAKKAAPGGIPAELPDANEVAEDMKAIVITANLPPKPALAILGHAKDDAAARGAVEEIAKLLDSEDVKQVLALPALAKLAPFLRPTQDGPRFKILLTEANGGMEALAAAIKTGLEMLGPAIGQGGLRGLPGQ